MDVKIGEIRKMAAEAFGIPFSEVKLHSKTKKFCQEDNESMLRIFGWETTFFVQRATSNLGNVKAYLAQNQTYINTLFDLLSKENTPYVDLTWNLLNNIPANKEMQEDIELIKLTDEEGWNVLLDSKSIYKFLYGLQMVESILNVEDKGSEGETKNKEKWMKKFCQTGGLAHLFNALMELSTERLYNPLSRKCFSLLIKIIYTIQDSGFTLKECVKDYAGNKIKMIERILVVLNAFSKYSVIKESAPSISEKNNKEAKDDENSQAQSKKELKEEGKTFEYGFSLIKNEEINYFECIMRFNEFKNFLLNGLVLTNNPFIKIALKKEVIHLFNLYGNKEYSETHAHVILITYMLKTMVKETLDKCTDCECFYELLCQMIRGLPKSANLKVLPINFKEEMKSVADYLKEHKIVENKSTDQDYLIIGLMNLLYELIAKFPENKNYIANDCGMLEEVLHKCLFEFPNSEIRAQLLVSIPPKCKSQASRHAALNLLFILCRDSPVSITKALSYLIPIHTNASWRTNRRSDWIIVSEADEKSITGCVGLKNLGAICYMNSLLQQFYMIPSFRNAILSAVDPEENASSDSLLFQTQCLFSALSKSVKQYYNPKAFCHALKDWDNNPINVLEQMDVDEFFNLFLDRLENTLKRTVQKNSIKQHFGGVFANQIIGKDCPHTSTREEPFLALNLQVKNKKSLQQCLESFVKGEMLQGNNAYFCDKCDKRVTALKRTCIKKLPRHLICVLKRFDINYDTMQKFKINDYCEFPKKISMEDYTEEGLAKKDIEKEEEKARREGRDLNNLMAKKLKIKSYPKEYYEYNLTGIVIHIGTSDMGHYYSIILDREHDDVPEDERWYEFNDTLVEKYNITKLKDDAFGNEGKLGTERYFTKMRNAYLLFYERASSYEPPEEEGEDAPEQKTNEAPVAKIDIPKELHKEIQAENNKYWCNKYIFQNNYFEFVLQLSLYWNSEEVVVDKYPVRNLDYHLLNLNQEDFKLCEHNPIRIEKPVETRLATPLSSEELNKTSMSVAKYVISVFLTTLIRYKLKTLLPNFVDLCKAYLNKHTEVSQWLIEQFSNSKIINEFLLECPEKLMSKFVVGLLYCSMLNVYKIEKSVLPECDPNKSILLNFANGLFKQLPTCNKSSICTDQFFQAFSRLAFLGPEIRIALLKQDSLKYLLGFLCSSNKYVKFEKLEWEDTTKLKWIENENVELGLPSVVVSKFPSPFKEFYSFYRDREAESSNTFLIETISFLLRSTGIDEKSKDFPFALEGCQAKLGITDGIISLLTSPKKVHELMESCKCFLSIIALTKALVHISWEQKEVKTTVAKGLTFELTQLDADNVDIYIYFIRMLLRAKDSLQEMAVDIVINNCLKAMKKYSVQHHVLPFIKLLLALIEELPVVENWFKNNMDKWESICTWFESNTTHNLRREAIICFNRISDDEQHLLEKNIKKYAECFAKLKKGENLGVGECTQDIDTMYYHKFVNEEVVEHISAKIRTWEQWVVKAVLDEMVMLKPKDFGESCLDWVDVEKNNIAKLGTHTGGKEESEIDSKDESDENGNKDDFDDLINKNVIDDNMINKEI